MQTKEKLLELLSQEDTTVLSQAYLYAKNLTDYGVDISNKWETATQQASALEKAYRKGYYDALQRNAESEGKVMKIPKEIVDKMKQVNSLMTEIDLWMDENIDVEGSKHDHRQGITGEYDHPDYYQFTNEAYGKEQNNGEYCDQWSVGESGDDFEGFYYYPTESNEFFYFQFWI